jgi:subtilisin family serine protease
LTADQWYLSIIQASSAWDVSTGNGVTVAVRDAGVDDSPPDLINNMVTGRNVVSNNNDTSPINVHGTAVAGAVAATGNNGAIDDPAILQGIEAVSDRALLITEPGLGLRLGGAALAAGY